MIDEARLMSMLLHRIRGNARAFWSFQESSEGLSVLDF